MPAIVEEVLRSPGVPLDDPTRATFEPRFGHDFSQVRIHSGDRAAESARAVDAVAYTVGHHVVFDTGRYEPGSEEGARLLAHELVHVVQQDGASGMPTRIGSPTDPLESGARDASMDPGGAAGHGEALQRQPAGISPWNAPGMIAAGLQVLGDMCTSHAHADGTITDESGKPSDPYSTHCPSRVCVHARVPLSLGFYVDVDVVPRPQPFTPPRVVASVEFVASTGGAQTPIPAQQAVGAYQLPGWPLRAPFRDGAGNPVPVDRNNAPMVPLVPSTPGILRIVLIISDQDSGEVAVYGDEVPVVDCGVRRPPPPKIGVPSMRQETGRHVFVKDPEGAPHDFREITGRLTDPAWDEPDKVFAVLHDERGDFFMVDDERIDVPPPTMKPPP